MAPDAFDIITLPPGITLSNNQRRNLASIAKILQFAASKKGVRLLKHNILNVFVSSIIIFKQLQDVFLCCYT